MNKIVDKFTKIFVIFIMVAVTLLCNITSIIKVFAEGGYVLNLSSNTKLTIKSTIAITGNDYIGYKIIENKKEKKNTYNIIFWFMEE